MSLASGLPTVFIRNKAKDYGTCQAVEGGQLSGKRVVLIEDVITTGGAVADAARLAREAGGEVIAVVCAIWRGEGPPNFADIVHGRASFQDRLGLVSGEIVPHLTCDQHIDYGFANDANLDVHLLEQFAKARSCGLTLRPATAQDHKRADDIWRNLGLQGPFDAICPDYGVSLI